MFRNDSNRTDFKSQKVTLNSNEILTEKIELKEKCQKNENNVFFLSIYFQFSEENPKCFSLFEIFLNLINRPVNTNCS